MTSTEHIGCGRQWHCFGGRSLWCVGRWEWSHVRWGRSSKWDEGDDDKGHSVSNDRDSSNKQVQDGSNSEESNMELKDT